MSHGVPDFPTLVKNYPNLKNSNSVKRNIGGAVADTIGDPQFDNTCTIRVSQMLNASGLFVPAKYPGLATMGGSNKHLRYAFRVREMRAYLTSKFGAPDVDVRGKPVARDKFTSVKGIIGFDIHFQDATGHFDLWDGHTFFDEVYGLSYRGHDFFEMADRVSVWRAAGDAQLQPPPDA